MAGDAIIAGLLVAAITYSHSILRELRAIRRALKALAKGEHE